MKQWILAKLLCDRVYFWAIFYATGYRVLSGLPHTPVTSLVKYPPGPIFGRFSFKMGGLSRNWQKLSKMGSFLLKFIVKVDVMANVGNWKKRLAF